MIVAAFLNWATTARSQDRAKAASALSRAYLQDQLDSEQRDAALTAMAHLVRDPSVKVRVALAEVLAKANNAPRHILLALANDQPDVAAQVLVYSLQLSDDDLIDICATGSSIAQSLIAARPNLSKALLAALCEVADVQAIMLLIERCDLQLSNANLLRLAERFADVPELREHLLGCDDLPVVARQLLLSAIAKDLAGGAFFIASLGEGNLQQIIDDGARSGNIHLLEEAQPRDLYPLIASLIKVERLTVDYLLCLAALGLGDAVAECLVQLSDGDVKKIRRSLAAGRAPAILALFQSAGIPPVAAQMLSEITIFWRSANPYDPLSQLVEQLRDAGIGRQDRLDRLSFISVIDRLIQERHFDHLQDDLRQIMLEAA